MTPNVAVFRDWLVEHQDLAPRTATVYASVIDYGQRNGDVAAAVTTARSLCTLRVVKAAVRWWSRWTGDRRATRRVRELARYQLRLAKVKRVTDEEREKLAACVRLLEEPYRSVMLVIVSSRLPLRTVFGLSREQLEVGATERVPLLGASSVETMWLPSEEVQQSFRVLGEYGGWERLRDLAGRDYFHAYRQVAAILRQECRRAGIRRLRPAELGRKT